jgi:sulfite dehydrogenase (quinone) subunit SoeC
MNPAFSVVVFTTVAGAAQGLVVALALALLAGIPLGATFVRAGLLVAIVLLVVALAASFLHLGRPARAWRAAAMWRTSWLSREVIVLPAFIALVAGWWLAGHEDDGAGRAGALLPLAALALAALLWYCTAMIYACLRFIEEWAQPLTLVNFVLLGLSSGWVLASALAALAGEARALAIAAPAALVVTLLAWAARSAAWRRNASIRHRSTLQTATGIGSARLAQTSMGMSAGSFNTREFFHRASQLALGRIKGVAIVFGFALPALLIAAVAVGALPELVCVAALVVQAPGLIADRWLFFAQAKHPQNLYYQVVS